MPQYKVTVTRIISSKEGFWIVLKANNAENAKSTIDSILEIVSFNDMVNSNKSVVIETKHLLPKIEINIEKLDELEKSSRSRNDSKRT